MTMRRIDPDDIPRFSIDDEKNFLYWDDKVIHTSSESVLSLTTTQIIVASIACFATVLSALASICSTYISVNDYNLKKAQKSDVVYLEEISSTLKAIRDKPLENNTSQSQPSMPFDTKAQHLLDDISMTLQAIRERLPVNVVGPSQSPRHPKARPRATIDRYP